MVGIMSSTENTTELNKGLLIDSLARLPEKTILNESMLAETLQVSTRTVRRMVSRFELPPPVQLGNHSVWTVGRILSFIDNALRQPEEESCRESERIRRLSP